MTPTEIAEATTGNWILAVLIVLVSFVIVNPFKSWLAQRVISLEGNNKPILASFCKAFEKGLRSVVFTVSIYAAIQYLGYTGRIGSALSMASEILVAIGFGHAFYLAIEIPCSWWARKTQESESTLDDMLVPVVEGCAKVILVFLVGVQIIQIASDKPLTSIVAGLGIGGLAIALASQDTLKNLFGSIMLMCDRPFDIGDRVIVSGHDGPVKRVGLRSTTIENLDGHKITIPNSTLANMPIQNIGVRPNIKRLMNVTLHADTPYEKVEKAIEILRRNIENHEGLEGEFEPRVYLNDIKPEGFNILVLYWYHPPAYWDFLAQCEKYNLAVIKELQQEQIKFAMPVQKVHLEQGMAGANLS